MNIIFSSKSFYRYVIDSLRQKQKFNFTPIILVINFIHTFMITSTHLLATQELLLTEQDDPSQCNLKILFQNIVANNARTPFIKLIHQLETKNLVNSQRIGNGKLISQKMRNKLLKWMENLALETFGFSIRTLILATKVFDQYLNLTDESPSVLQLIGSSCLYLAAKTYEPTIVACQCYVVASANIFTEKQLFEKELEIYKKIGYNTNLVCPLRVYKWMAFKSNYTIVNNCSSSDLEFLFFDIAKNTEFSNFETFKVISMVLAFTEVRKKIPTINELLQKLKNIGCPSNQPHC